MSWHMNKLLKVQKSTCECSPAQELPFCKSCLTHLSCCCHAVTPHASLFSLDKSSPVSTKQAPWLLESSHVFLAVLWKLPEAFFIPLWHCCTSDSCGWRYYGFSLSYVHLCGCVLEFSAALQHHQFLKLCSSVRGRLFDFVYIKLQV